MSRSPSEWNPREILDARLASPARGWMLAETTLRHFALINYALPAERLRPHIPADRFDLPEFMIAGRPMAMLSAVPFLDVDFRFRHLLPFLKFEFGQTNHRAYVIDRATGEHAVWFFGTTLGSPVVAFPRLLWGIPWHRARYRIECDYDADAGRYRRYEQWIESDWCAGRASLEDTGLPASGLEGFPDDETMRLVLTHPVAGFFRLRNGEIGTYSVRHPEMKMTLGSAREARFDLYERLGLLSPEEMAAPHSVLLLHEVPFQILLPPRRAGRAGSEASGR